MASISRRLELLEQKIDTGSSFDKYNQEELKAIEREYAERTMGRQLSESEYNRFHELAARRYPVAEITDADLVVSDDT